jgi:hypothetical protein
VKELSIAESRKRRIIPVVFEQCEIPPEMEYQLAGLQWVDFSESEFDDALGRLASALSAETGKASSSAAAGAATAAKPAKRPRAEPNPKSIAQTLKENLPDLSLAQTICGQWNVRIDLPYVGTAGQMTVQIRPDGYFTGQLVAPMGMTQVTGTWRLSPGQQLELAGQQTLGWNSAPYYVAIRFMMVTPTMLTGASAAGEGLTFTKIA